MTPSRRLKKVIEQAPTLASPKSCKILRGEHQILAASGPLRSLRVRTGQQDDVTTDPEWFVSMTIASKRIPWVVELFDGEELVAAMLFAERLVSGFPSGYLKADGAFGEEFLICPPALSATYMPMLLGKLFDQRSVSIAHVAQSVNAETAFAHLPDETGIEVEWKPRPSHYRLPLRASMEETLAPYGVRTRRNLRYYLRKSRSEGCQFLSELNGEERLEAVSSLTDRVTHNLSIKATLLREKTMQATREAFALGMRAADGSWLSYLTGWRRGQRTFVYWQMNHVTSGNSSISTAMRAFLMEKEIARGTKEIVFVGGTSLVLMRCCEEDLCVDLIARRRSLRSRLLSLLLRRLLPPGHPLSNR